MERVNKLVHHVRPVTSSSRPVGSNATSSQGSLTVYGRRNGANVQKVLWFLDELGLEYTQIDAGGDFNLNKNNPEWREINPNGTVPVLVDSEEGFPMFESNSILRFLARKYQHLMHPLWYYPAKPAAGQIIDQYMDWCTCVITAPSKVVHFALYRTPEKDRDHKAFDGAVTECHRLWAIFDKHLATRNFVVGDVFTIGDIPLGVWAHRYFRAPFDRPSLPNVERWYKTLCSRSAYNKHIASLPIS